ncbi:macrophage mannose receptor 1 [Elysia marginata]|uniref:Macrophage mannose receptor 1 n=1 Tax=Elysia marginata TaxID=1093978 RepID=A0AAV4EYR1_9GAST|nr:macrophage mannose receptor 1 [Elysia marginata]
MQDPTLSDFTSDVTELRKSMTQQFCINKCFQRDYPFAGLFSGTKCQCGVALGRNGIHRLESCDQPCPGDSTQKCGGGWHEVSVFTTGAALPPAPARCGPLSRGVFYQGKCIHLNYVREDFWSAETRCQAQGGTLAKIDTQDKMKFIEAFLQNVDGDIWFGAKGTDTSWHFLDGTPVTYSNWRHLPIKPQNKRFLYLQQYRRFKWNLSVYNAAKMSLCDLNLQPPATLTGNCGHKRRGENFGSHKRCFARVENLLTFQDAVFSCRRMLGRMVTFQDPAEKADVEVFLNNVTDDVRYWVDATANSSTHRLALTKKIPRQTKPAEMTNRYRTLCLLDVRYNGVLDAMVKSNGETADQSFWLDSDYLQSLSSGLCVVSDVGTGAWQHTPCSSQLTPAHAVVCEATPTFFEKLPQGSV